MNFWIGLVIFVFVIAILFIGLMILTFIGMSSFMKPNETVDSVDRVKKFMEIDFGDDFEVLEHVSRNNHPDRPMHISIKLSKNSSRLVEDFLNQKILDSSVSSGEKMESKSGDYWTKDLNGYKKRYSAFHPDAKFDDLPYYVATAEYLFNEGLIKYRESFI